jgi:hypothetical protein
MTEEQPESCKIDVPQESPSTETPTVNSEVIASPQESNHKAVSDYSSECKPDGSETIQAADDPTKSCKVDVSEKSETPQVSGIQKVYRWAASNVGESEEYGEDRFYVPPAYLALLYKLQNTEKSLSMITGLQGTGKTRLLCELGRNEDGSNCVNRLRIKWTKNWKKEFIEKGWNCQFAVAYQENLRGEFGSLIHILRENGQEAKLRKIGNPITYETNLDYASIEALIGKAKCKKLKEDAFCQCLSHIRVFMVDMPDYNKSNVNAMNHDVDAIQEFYEYFGTSNTHFIIAVQKELIMKNPHFFWNKCDKYTINPLTPSQLIEAYNLNNPDSTIFASAALQYLSEVSMGVFRRFKKYIRLSIEANGEQQLPISEELAKKAITDDVIFEDLDQELADIFDNEENRRCASKILGYLRSHSKVNVKTIAEDIGISETMAQKIVQKLELYNYVKTEPGKGKEKIVSLQH